MKNQINKSPKNISITAFDYHLPEDRIAKYPLEPRDSSQLLVYKKGQMTSDFYRHLHHHIPENSLLILNNTKVVEARLLFKKATGGTIEIFCLEPHTQYGDMTNALTQKSTVVWKCLVGGAKKWKDGSLQLSFAHGDSIFTLNAKMIAPVSNVFFIEFSWNQPELCFAEVLHYAGVIPLPPYLKRQTEASDKQTYQTVYAQSDGSVAAPTAGLHFTPDLFKNLKNKNITPDFVTLHVGAGTFMPVKSETLAEHDMHAEFIDVSLDTINKLLSYDEKTIIAVGTTSLRTLESLYWMGVKALTFPDIFIENIHIQQWDAYELAQNHTPKAAFTALKSFMETHNLKRIITKTQLLIAPSYKLRTVDAIITNFHQPQSTLLLLIHAFVGDDWKNIYDFALNNQYRFLSYGDGSLLWKR